MNEIMGMSYASLYYAEVGKNNELQKENKKLKELCDKYEEEHNTTFEYWKHLIKEDYKTRIDKAIEEINKRSSKEVAKLYIDILKGDNK